MMLKLKNVSMKKDTVNQPMDHGSMMHAQAVWNAPKLDHAQETNLVLKKLTVMIGTLIAKLHHHSLNGDQINK